MKEFLGSVDVSVFQFLNQTIANPFFDWFMPFITDANKHWYGLAAFACGLLWLYFKGGEKGKVVALFVIVLLVITDQLSSAVIKPIILRPRPCWNEAGVLKIPYLRLLVNCGGGYSFPSTHAVNSFAIATFVSGYYRRGTPYLFGAAVLLAVSRTYVGVHYPSDILGGAIIGTAVALAFSQILARLGRKYPRLTLTQISREVSEPV